MIQTRQITLLNDYPRSMGCPHQDFIARSKEDRLKYIQDRKKNCNLYLSVYKFPNIDRNTESHKIVHGIPYIDKIFFDFDGEGLNDFWLSNLIKIRKWCKERDVIHYFQYSGNGAHAFIYITPNIQYQKEAVGNFQRYLAKTLDLQLDRKIIGDTSRIFRHPQTYNFKGRRWCIPIPPSVLDDPDIDEAWFMRKATKSQNFNGWSGSKLLNISRFDVDEFMYMEYDTDYDIGEIDEEIAINYPQFPPCVQAWLSTPTLNSKGKFYLIFYLKNQIAFEIPFDSQDIVSILKQTLNSDEFNHYFGNQWLRGHEGHNGLKFTSIMKNSSYKMASCRILKKHKLCPYDCGRLNPIYDW